VLGRQVRDACATASAFSDPSQSKQSGCARAARARAASSASSAAALVLMRELPQLQPSGAHQLRCRIGEERHGASSRPGSSARPCSACRRSVRRSRQALQGTRPALLPVRREGSEEPRAGLARCARRSSPSRAGAAQQQCAALPFGAAPGRLSIAPAAPPGRSATRGAAWLASFIAVSAGSISVRRRGPSRRPARSRRVCAKVRASSTRRSTTTRDARTDDV